MTQQMNCECDMSDFPESSADPLENDTTWFNGDDTWDYSEVPDPVYNDIESMQVDADFDGFAETTIIEVDGDGVADAALVTDPETGETVAMIDTDADGTFDTIAIDTDGDGIPDTISDELTLDSTTLTTDDTTDSDDPFIVPDDTDVSIDSSIEDDDPNVHGDPMAEIQYHHAQPGPVDCLPTSVSMVLSEITGEDVPADELVALANEKGFMTDTGMSPENSVALFEAYGVDAEVQTGTLDELRTMLDDGRDVIIGLDSSDLYAQQDGPFQSDMVSGHAVVITGIDDEAGMVYINDPGFPDGAGVAIPIDEFEDAWEDSDHTMVVTEERDLDDDASSDDVAGAAGSDDDGGRSLLDIVLLPFTLVVNR
jgi:hypothetical protein